MTSGTPLGAPLDRDLGNHPVAAPRIALKTPAGAVRRGFHPEDAFAGALATGGPRVREDKLPDVRAGTTQAPGAEKAGSRSMLRIASLIHI